MITISKGLLKLDYKGFLFPGGEVGVKLDTRGHLLYRAADVPHQVVARIHNSNDLMELVLLTDALRRFDNQPIELALPYMPYGRQDRACVDGESASLLAFSRIINMQGYEKVTTFDPHSDVTAAVINDIITIDQIKIFGQFDALTHDVIKAPLVLVSPDAGSNKKVAALASYFERPDFIRADKKRDLSTGRIVSTEVYGDVKDKNLLIVDDICDGGRTFIELAMALYAKGAATVNLYVTHGIFSKGTKVLHDAGIKNIFTTNSFYQAWPGDAGPQPHTLDLDKAFRL